MSIGIDTEKLNAQIEKLEKTKTNLSTIFQNVKTDTTKLKEDWDSKASSVVYEEFDRFDRASEDYIEDLDGFISYLKNAVNQSYEDYEKKENELIDNNIATN